MNGSNGEDTSIWAMLSFGRIVFMAFQMQLMGDEGCT